MRIRKPTAPQAFTLVELLAVVAIITLLIAILVPSVNAVRKSAKKTVTSATLNSLSIGLETFRTQGELGDLYPPSASDDRPNSGGNLTYEIASPYENLGDKISGANHPADTFAISGAGLLYFALAGADGLGSPAFRAVEGKDSWGESLSDEDGGLYHIYDTGDRAGQPQSKRYGPFIELGSVASSAYDVSKQRFAIPLEEAARAGSNEFRNYPMFLDGFGAPILYWRADRAGKRIADAVPDNVDGPGRGIYHFRDNAALLAPSFETQDETNLVLGSERNGQPLHDLDFDVPNAGASIKVTDFLDSNDRDDSFGRHIIDTKVTARAQPQNADKFLLLSPGPDLIYGTRDDIGNFEPNGGLK